MNSAHDVNTQANAALASSFSRIAARTALCKAAKSQARWIWRTLKDSEKHACAIHEESLTDFFVLNLLRKNLRGFHIRSFTRIAESKNGSDWEWWFGSHDGTWLAMRVQAKVINFPGYTYKHLYYTPKSGQPQVDSLINQAKWDRMIPIYCLYSCWDKSTHTSVKALAKLYGRKVENDTLYGAAILSAYQVQKGLHLKMNQVIDLFPNLMPLHNLFCTSTYPTMGFSQSVCWNALASGLLGRIQLPIRESDLSDWIIRDVPRYVTAQQGVFPYEEKSNDLTLSGVMVIQEIR